MKQRSVSSCLQSHRTLFMISKVAIKIFHKMPTPNGQVSKQKFLQVNRGLLYLQCPLSNFLNNIASRKRRENHACSATSEHHKILWSLPIRCHCECPMRGSRFGILQE